ncbi:MAG TPA: peptide chain release factor N(5)-glutamine methyltransferase [Gemmatimonadaceae bacterium]|nr:peptide chain release factor N(5)-glutamine methyltransferase [Gemmatimonadaceae bacterium]
MAERRGSATGVDGTTVVALRNELRMILQGAGIADAWRESADIIAALMDAPRFWAGMHGAEMVAGEVRRAALEAARCRTRGAPFAYAVGRSAFRHLTLLVDERVLIPRAETEELVDAVLERLDGNRGGVVVDVGTGSGAIALALATEGHFLRVIGTDVSLGALAVARTNAARLCTTGTAVEFRHGSLLQPVRGLRTRAIVSNPPYIAYEEATALPESVRNWEPPIALFSGDAGMAATRAIIRAAVDVLEPGGLLALEVDARRAALAAEAALATGWYRDVTVRLDLAGRERILLANREDD